MKMVTYYNRGDRVKHTLSGLQGTVFSPGNKPIVDWDNGSRLPGYHIRIIRDNFIKNLIKKIKKYL